MVFSMRWKLLMATVGALAFGACGDEETKGDDNGGGGGGGQQDAGLFGEIEALLDGGLEALLDGAVFAELDDNVSGAACKQASDCAGKNASCSVTLGGDRTGACSGLCMEDKQCGVGGKCVQIVSFGENAASFCSKVCSSDSDCDPELECRKGVDVSDVLNGIFEFLDGGIDGLNATETPKVCQEKADTVHLANGAVGKACTADTAATVCGGGTCETLLNPGGYCTGQCLADSDCGNTGGCARDALSTSLGLTGSCRLKCTSNAECREDEGYACQTAELLLGPGKYCTAQFQFDAGGGGTDAGAGSTTADASDGSDAGT